jgi:adhesin HecA-like repeat protein
MELGFDPERMQKRLGDAGYEQRLIQQQIIAQTGRHLLAGKRDEAAQMQALFESAAGQAGTLGLRFGVALGEEQINALDRDIVWMVEQEVRGEKVLAPVVYLSRASREGVERGTVIAADDVTMQVASLDNRGGVITGRDRLTVRATDDVRNISGTVKGGSVDLQSAAGDIVNATLTETSGDPYQTRTVIGKTARIESTGDMRLDAGRHIAVKGAQVQAAGDGTLRAGGRLEVDAVADRRADATSASVGMLTGLDRQGWSSSIATTVHQDASISAGGALDASSAGDMRIAGSKVHAGGDLLLKAGGDLTVTGRDDTMTIRNSVTTSAAGIGGGLSGTQTVIVEKDRSRNLASTVSSDGKAVVVADKDVLVQGSSVAAKDKLIIAGDAVTVAAARDSDRSSTTVSTVSFLKADAAGKASASASADGRASVIDQQRVEALKMVDGELVQNVRGGAGSKNENSLSGKRSFTTGSTMDEKGKSETKSESVRKDETIALNEKSAEGERPVSVKPGKGTGAAGSGEASSRSTAEASASGNASAAASASGKAGVKLVEHIVEKEEHSSERLARSTLSGSDVSLLAKQDAILEAATVRAARDLTLQGRNVRIESGQDKTVASTTRQVTAVGVLVNSTNTASAEASGSAKADAKVSHLARPQGHDGDANARASVEASVKVAAKSDNKVDLFRSNETTEAVTTIRQAGSDIEAGGRLAVTAGNDMLVEGSALKGKAAVNLDAARMNFAAADDSVTRSTSSTDIGAGLALLADGNAQASGKASVSVETGGKLADRGLLDRNSAQANVAGTAAASASASADARGEAGLQAQYRHVTAETRSTTAKVARIVSGSGDVTRTAAGEIRDVGTVIDAAADFSQRAGAINSLAARNTTSEKTVSDNHQGRLTGYAKAGAVVAATASAKGGAGAGYLGGKKREGESASETFEGTRGGARMGGQLE